MNKKAESVRMVVVLCTALILIGLGFIAFSKSPVITSKTTYSREACFSVSDGKLSVAEIAFCCSEIKKSNGCKIYNAQEFNNEFFICEGDESVVVNKETIEFCD